MPVPNAPAGGYVPAINPTGNGAVVTGVGNAPLTQQAADPTAVIDWNPVTPVPADFTVDPEITNEAGILDADNQPVTGSAGPPYVAGNVPVGVNQVGTNVVLPPPVSVG